MWAPRIGKGRASRTKGDGGCEYGERGGDHRPRVSRRALLVKLGCVQALLCLEGLLTLPTVGPGWITGKGFMLIFLCSVIQSCPTLYDLMDCSSPGSSVHGILQARILEWGAISNSRGSSRLRDRTRFSCVSCIGRWIIYHERHLGSNI